MWVKSQPWWNQKHQPLEFCGNQDFTLYSSCFINVNGYGWIREGMLRTAPPTLTFPPGAAKVRGLLLSFQVIPMKNWGDFSERNVGGNNTEVKPCSDISYFSRYRKMEPWQGGQIPWKAWSALALRSGVAQWGPCWAGCQSNALSWFILHVAQEYFTCNFFGVELSIQKISALWESSIFAIKENSF